MADTVEQHSPVPGQSPAARTAEAGGAVAAAGASAADRLGERWRAGRPGLAVTHLDSAAASVPSRSVRDAQAAYLDLEIARGSYVAQYEVAPERLAGARGLLAGLLDPALTAADVAFQYCATAAFGALVNAWPLPRGGRVGIVPSDYSSNWFALRERGQRDGLTLVDLPVAPDGRIDVARLATGTGPAALDTLDLVTFPEVPSQRGIVQPTAAVADLCRRAGVPLLLDVAQSLGQVDVTVAGATGGVSAYAGTARKWMCGPRGVGFLAVRPDFVERLGLASATGRTAVWRPDDLGEPDGAWPPVGGEAGRVIPAPGLRRFDVGEAPTAAWLGFAAALTEHVESGPALVRARVHALAAAARERLGGVAGWRLGEAPDSPCGIVTLRPPPGVDPAAVKDRLRRDEGILVSAIDGTRARDAVPVLRVSAHAYNQVDEIERLAGALERATC